MPETKIPIQPDIIVDVIDRERMGTGKFIEPFPVREAKDLVPVKGPELPPKKVSLTEMYGTLPKERLHATRVWNKVRPLSKGDKRAK